MSCCRNAISDDAYRVETRTRMLRLVANRRVPIARRGMTDGSPRIRQRRSRHRDSRAGYRATESLIGVAARPEAQTRLFRAPALRKEPKRSGNGRSHGGPPGGNSADGKDTFTVARRRAAPRQAAGGRRRRGMIIAVSTYRPETHGRCGIVNGHTPISRSQPDVLHASIIAGSSAKRMGVRSVHQPFS